MKVISILGCGWLGLPLAERLVQQGHAVKGSTTTPDKIDLLNRKNIAPYLVNCSAQCQGPQLNEFFDADVLVITLPFRRNLEDPAFYYTQIKSIADYAAQAKTSFVIFTSSTSIYPSTIAQAVEDVDWQPDNPRSQVLFDIERLLLENKNFDATIIRLAGLYGGNRRIGQFLSGKTDLPNPDSPVNLIHQDDVVGIIAEVIKQDIRHEILNACSDAHPTRRALYTKAADALGLPPPVFTEKDAGAIKIVSNKKLKERLRYAFKYPDPSRFA